MRRTSLQLALLLPLALGFGCPSFSSDIEGANRLFVSAVKAWNQAEALADSDVTDTEARVALLQDVVTGLEEIIDNHSGSELAVKLVTGEKVGPISFEEAKLLLEAASTDLEMAQCFQEPSHDCVYLAALKTHLALDDNQQMGALANIAVSLARKGHEQKVDRILEILSPEDLGVDNLLAIGEGLKRPEMFDEALKIALAEDRAWLRRIEIVKVIKAQASYGMITEAFQTTKEFDNADDVYYSFSDIAGVLARNGDFERAITIADGISHLDAQSSARLKIVGAFSAAGRADEAFSTTLNIDNDYYRSLAFIQVGVVKKDAAQIQAAISSTKGLDDRYRDIVIETAAEALGEIGKVHEAHGALMRVSSNTRNEAIIGGIASHQAKAGNIQEALQTAGFIDDPSEKEWIWRSVAESQARSGQLEDAMKSAQAINDDYRRGLTYCIVAEAAADVGQVRDALQILRRVNPSYSCRSEALGLIAAMLES